MENSSRILGVILVLIAPTALQAQRAKRPDWSTQKTNDVFFEDAFRDGLKGERPDSSSPTAAAETAETKTLSWSDHVEAATLENEIKQALVELKRLPKRAALAGPAALQLKHQLHHLAATLGVIAQYDGEVRWRAVAGNYAQRIAQLAGEPSSATMREDAQGSLEALVAGTAVAEAVPVDVDALATRPSIMIRLQKAEAAIKAALSNPRDFQRRQAMIIRETEIIALQALILTLPELDDSADDDYVSWCRELREQAAAIATATREHQLEAAQQHFGAMQRSCTDCHEMYRG